MGNALRPQHHEEDVALMLEMGVNAVRLAHYPQATYFYDLMDKKELFRAIDACEDRFIRGSGRRYSKKKTINDSKIFLCKFFRKHRRKLGKRCEKIVLG